MAYKVNMALQHHRIRLVAPMWVALGVLLSGCVASTPSRRDVTEGNFATLREQILPKPSELAWTQIPWRSSFHEGLAEALVQRKPLLFWAMNGHPLGCT